MGGVSMTDHVASRIPIDRTTIDAFAIDFVSKNTNATAEDILEAARARFNIWWGKQTGKTAIIKAAALEHYQARVATTSNPPSFRIWWSKRCDHHTREIICKKAITDWEEAVLRAVREEYIKATRSQRRHDP